MAAGIPEYDEIRIRIEPGTDGGYRVLASTLDGSTAHGGFALPWNTLELENFLLRVGRPRRSGRGAGASSQQMEEAKRFGGELFDALIQRDVAETYDGARHVASTAERGLRVTLQLSSVPELMEVPWEFLYERPNFLAQSIYTPVVRSLDLKRTRPPRKITPPLRILGMISAPEGYPQLDVEGERSRLDAALGRLQAAGLVELLWLENATLAELDSRIAAPDEIHVFHYIGHGSYDDATTSGVLILEDADGRPHEVSGEELSSVLVDEHSLRLAVLNACEGARASHVDPFSGVASSLVQCGIEAVVGMQFEITDSAAVAFSQRLYTALSQGFAVDAAMAQSRRAILTGGNGVEFATPVLFLRGADTRLFDVDLDAARIPVPVAAPDPPPAAPDPPPAAPDPPPSDRAAATTPPATPSGARGAAAAGAWRALTGDPRRRLAATAGLVLALAVGIFVLVSGGDAKRERGPERAFIQRVDSMLQRSRPAFVQVNRAYAQLLGTEPGTTRSQDLDAAESTLKDVRAKRRDLAGEANAFAAAAPTSEARSVALALARSFDRSAENNLDLQNCVPRDATGRVRYKGAACLQATAGSSTVASEAKNAFRARYNALRRSLGLPEKQPSF